MGESPFTFILAHTIAGFYIFTIAVLGGAVVEQVMSWVTPYQPVILEALQSDNRSH